MGDSPTAAPPSPGRLFLLVTALSVPFWVLGWADGTMLPAGLPISSLMVVCPLVAALVLVRRREEPGAVRRLLGRLVRRPDPWWLLAAVLVMPAVSAVTAGINHQSLTVSPLAVAASLGVFLVAAACEEVAWSGYAIDPLAARFGELSASLVLGTFWAAWHVIPWYQVHDLSWTAWQALFTVAARVVIVRLYTGARRNVPVAVAFHCMINVCFAVLGPDYRPMPTALITVGLAICLRTRGRGTPRGLCCHRPSR